MSPEKLHSDRAHKKNVYHLQDNHSLFQCLLSLFVKIKRTGQETFSDHCLLLHVRILQSALAATAELKPRGCFQHHGEMPHCWELQTCGSANVEETRRSTNLPLNKTSTRQKGKEIEHLERREKEKLSITSIFSNSHWVICWVRQSGLNKGNKL